MKNARKTFTSKIRVFSGGFQVFFRLKRAFSNPPFCAPALLPSFKYLPIMARMALGFFSKAWQGLANAATSTFANLGVVCWELRNIYHHHPVSPRSPILSAGYSDKNIYVCWVPHTAHKHLTAGHPVARLTPPPSPSQSPTNMFMCLSRS